MKQMNKVNRGMWKASVRNCVRIGKPDFPTAISGKLSRIIPLAIQSNAF
jgi:hypothetical protein